MTKINKVDYFVGVFLSSILKSAKAIPALFDQTTKSKKVEFETNNHLYNVYIKYSTNLHTGKENLKGQKRESCSISITDGDIEKLGTFHKKNAVNYIAIVCTNKELTNSRIVIIDFDSAMEIIKNTPKEKQKRIDIFRYGAERNFHYKGVGHSDSESKDCDVNFMSYFQ